MGIVVIRQLSKLLKSKFLSKPFFKNTQASMLKDGGRYRARTSDPLLVRQVLSQLS